MDNKKQIIIIIVCIILAVVAFFTFRKPKLADEICLVLCSNCNNISEMSVGEYSEQLSELDAGTIVKGQTLYSIFCPECGKRTACKAMKCEKCVDVFRLNYADLANFDKCPKCEHRPERKKETE